MKHLLIILSILLLSSPVIGDNHKGETLYQWGNTLPYVWKSVGSKKLQPKYEGYSGPHKWDNVLRCIFNQMELPNGQKKVQQGIEGSNCAWRNKGSENDSRISLRIWGTCKPDKYMEEGSYLMPLLLPLATGKIKMLRRKRLSEIICIKRSANFK